MVLILAAVLADKIKILIPTAILSCSMIPYATMAIIIKCSSLILPKKIIQHLDNFLYTMYLRTTLFVFENISAVKIILYGDVEELKKKVESALVISNHQSNVDWAIINMLAARQTSSGNEQAIRFVLKDEIHYIPLFGWYILQRGYVYVKRFGNFVPEPVLQQFKRLSSLNQSFWLHIFPEGTRFRRDRPEVIKKSVLYCKQQYNNENLFKNVLCPRLNAFSMAVNKLRKNLDCIYDVTIAYSHKSKKNLIDLKGQAPSMLEFCGSPDPYEIHVYVQRIPISNLSYQDVEQKNWLLDKFKKKDDLLDDFYKNGHFLCENKEVLKKLPIQRNLIPFLYFTATITVLPFYSIKVRQTYALTLAISPLLILWLYVRKSV